MMQLRELRLVGQQVKDARMEFKAGGNVIAGDSDTGKSYMLRCMDFILGAKAMTKRIEEAALYERILLEFENTTGKFMTLVRHLTGGDIAVHYCRIDQISDEGETVLWRRQGKSTEPDISSVFLPFADMSEAELRRTKRGETQRLTIRTLLPLFLVDEISIVDEQSPVFDGTGYNETASKRVLSYQLTGKDDSGVIAEQRRDIVNAQARAKLALIEELLEPIEKRLQDEGTQDHDEKISSIEVVDSAIESLSNVLTVDRDEQARLQRERQEALAGLQRAEGQLLAIDELLSRYQLLDGRYSSDLERLDFVAEGAHFLSGLQAVRCPLCDQPMNPEHLHRVDGKDETHSVYQSARAEAAKILGHRSDLMQAIESLQSRRKERDQERQTADASITRIDARVEGELVPALRGTKSRLDQLIQKRVDLEGLKLERDQAETLRALRADIEQAPKSSGSSPKDWASIEPSSLTAFCREIEGVLKDWAWNGEGRVEFDEKEFDIRVDGRPRQSHGKGVRAVLHAAFTIALLRYCQKNKKPHPGFVVLDSPLTTYKHGRAQAQQEEPLDPGIEAAFWNSLTKIDPAIQVVILDNKEPPASITSVIHYVRFAGSNASPGQRSGFIPPQ